MLRDRLLGYGFAGAAVLSQCTDSRVIPTPRPQPEIIVVEAGECAPVVKGDVSVCNTTDENTPPGFTTGTVYLESREEWIPWRDIRLVEGGHYVLRFTIYSARYESGEGNSIRVTVYLSDTDPLIEPSQTPSPSGNQNIQS